MEEIRHYILTINYKRFVSNKCAEILSGACFGFGKRSQTCQLAYT
jgi:hypothetical protein